MKKKYLVPEVLFIHVINEGILYSATEPNVSGWVGAKEGSVEEETMGSSDIEYDGPKNNIWNDDED